MIFKNIMPRKIIKKEVACCCNRSICCYIDTHTGNTRPGQANTKNEGPDRPNIEAGGEGCKSDSVQAGSVIYPVSTQLKADFSAMYPTAKK